jgi:hypothetical protein
MPHSSSLPGRRLSTKQVRELLNTGGGIADSELTKALSMDAYQLPADAALVVLPNGRGVLYESRADLKSLIDEVAHTKPLHLLTGKIPQGKLFAAEAAQLMAEFIEHMDIPLDGTESSLDSIDRLIRQRRASTFLQPTEYPRLLAYVGEVVRHLVNGHWQMVLAEDGETWEPWIVDSSGGRHPVFAILAKELTEWNRRSSIRGAIAGHLWASGFS